jgi:hypothetical protein
MVVVVPPAAVAIVGMLAQPVGVSRRAPRRHSLWLAPLVTFLAATPFTAAGLGSVVWAFQVGLAFAVLVDRDELRRAG